MENKSEFNVVNPNELERPPLILKPSILPTMSEKINELAQALSKAQAKINNPTKNCIAKIPTKKGGVFTYKYAGLPSILDVIKQPFADNGLSIVQLPSSNGRTMSIDTVIFHESGQFIKSNMSMVAVDDRPQSLGSAITYIRRYALAAMIGIAAEDDEDGTLSSGHTDRMTHQPQQKTVLLTVKKPTITEVFKKFGVTSKDIVSFMPQASIEERTEILRDIYKRLESGESQPSDFFKPQENIGTDELNNMF